MENAETAAPDPGVTADAAAVAAAPAEAAADVNNGDANNDAGGDVAMAGSDIPMASVGRSPSPKRASPCKSPARQQVGIAHGGISPQAAAHHPQEIDESVSVSKVGQFTSVDDGATLQASFAQVHNTRESSCQTVADPLSDPDVVVWKLRLAAGRRGRDVFENDNEHEIGVNLDLKRRKTMDANKHDTGVGPDEPINGDVDMTEN